MKKSTPEELAKKIIGKNKAAEQTAKNVLKHYLDYDRKKGQTAKPYK